MLRSGRLSLGPSIEGVGSKPTISEVTVPNQIDKVAAYLVSQWLGWDFIPETIIRDGPYGVGSVQCYVEAEDDA